MVILRFQEVNESHCNVLCSNRSITVCVRERQVGGRPLEIMTKNNIHTLRYIHRKRGNEKCNLLQSRCYWFAAWFLSLSLSLSLPSAPGSCHSRTLRLSSSRDRYLHIIIFPSYMRAHTHFLLKCTHSNSLALLPGHWLWNQTQTDVFCSLLLFNHD